MKNEVQSLNYCNKAITLKKDIETTFLVLGEHLYAIKEKELYEPNWSSWEEFCMELKMSSNMINKLIQIYKTFVLGYGFTNEQIATAGGWGVIQEILPMVSSKKEALKWLAQAAILNRSDLRKTLIESRSGVVMKDCKHKNTYTIRICRECGQKWEEHKPHAN